MDRTLKVLGSGFIQAKPDYLYIYMSVEGSDKDYSQALKKGKRQLAAVSEAIQVLGFDQDALKTMDFSVSTDYVRNADAHGRFKNELNSYICRYRVRLGMDLDMKLAQSVLAALQNLVDTPRTSIDFTVKNPKAVDEELLEKTIADAFFKADIICKASQIEKGDILSIEYSNSIKEYTSPTHYLPTQNYKSPSKKNFHPEDILCSDTVTVIWEIKNAGQPLGNELPSMMD